MLSLAWKEITRRWSRAVLSIAGYFLVALLIAAGICLGDAIRRATTEPLDVTGSDLVVLRKVAPCAFAEVKRPKDLGAIPMEAVKQIARIPGVRAVTGSLVVWAFRDGRPTVVTGVEPSSTKTGPLRQYRSGERCCVLEDGRLFEPGETDVAILDHNYAEQQGVKVGDSIGIGPRTFKVVGILKVSGVAVISGGQAYIPLQTAQEMLGEGPVIDYIFVSTQKDADLDAIQQKIREIVGPGCEISTRATLPEQVSRSAAITATGSTAFVVLIAVVGALLMIRAALAMVRERVVEIGILRAIGWRRRHVVGLLGVEMMLQGVFGALPGLIVGYGVAFLVCSRLNLTLPTTFNSYPACATTAPALTLTLLPRVTPGGVATTIALTIAVALVAGLVAGRYAAARDPVDSLRQP